MITLDEALASGHGVWRTFTCPDHDDRSPSARVNAVTGKWVCMVCGNRGKAKTYEPPERLVIARVRKLDAEKRVLSESYLDMFDASGPGEYWSNRFKTETCQYFRLGYDIVREKSVYPIRHANGDLAGLVYRNFPDEKPKYRYPRDISTSELLFNYENIVPGQPVVVVEGAPDVIALWEVGVQAVGTFGARLFPAQRRLLRRCEPSSVVLAYDMDEAGHKGAEEASWDLRREGLKAVRLDWDTYNDVGDMPERVRANTFKKYLARDLTVA